MAFKITKVQAMTLGAHKAALARCRKDVEAKWRTLQSELEDLTVDVNAAIEAYNRAADAAQKFCETVAEEHRSAYDDKSETWQNGERGQAALSFVEEWENVNLHLMEEIAIVEPDAPDFDNVEERLDVLPEEADA